jgi:hypothetical protein
LDLTFASSNRGGVGGERQIRSTSAAFLFEVPEQSSPLVVQELQIGGTSLRRSRATWPDMAELAQDF